MEGNSSNLRKEHILGLDLATKTGYYSVYGYGTWNFRQGEDRNNNKTYLAFYTTLKDFIQRYGIRKIVTEDINFSIHNSDYRKLNELRGILRMLTEELDLLPVEFVSVRALKKFATQDGMATKEQMIAACVNHYRFYPQDDNQADACHLYHYFVRKRRIF